MGAELRIEGPEAATLASELAELTGTSVQDAVTQALRDGVAHERSIKKRAAGITGVAAEIRSHMSKQLPMSDHSWLYGDDGLPA